MFIVRSKVMVKQGQNNVKKGKRFAEFIHMLVNLCTSCRILFKLVAFKGVLIKDFFKLPRLRTTIFYLC